MDDGARFAAPPPGRDPYCIAGKFQPPDQRFDVVVVGAGAAGTEAAIDARHDGASVLLVDEHPVAPSLIGLDTPYYWGGRATAAVQNTARMVEQVFAANARLETAFEAGVELRLGTSVWGAFVNGPGLNALPGPVVGLADEARSWLCGFERLIVAAGARDLVFSFQGWDQPGVMGAQALHALLTRYEAFAGRRIVVLGSGDLALSTALLALERGVEVVALVEVRDRPQGSGERVAQVIAAGTPILTSHTILAARGGVDGVEQVSLIPIGGRSSAPVEIACDTICQAVGLVPAVELLDVLGARLTYDAVRGGHAPVLGDASGRTTLPGVFAVGDCAGLAPIGGEPDYALDWMRALTAVGDGSVLACQCEEVSRAALTGVHHPAYLGPLSAGLARRSLETLAADGPLNPDQIKRLTRACMGACQARRCREQVAMTLALAAGAPLAQIPLAGYRAPVRPLPLAVLADMEEPAEMGAGWDVWFGIPTQWIPYADIGGEREAMHIAALGGDMHL